MLDGDGIQIEHIHQTMVNEKHEGHYYTNELVFMSLHIHEEIYLCMDSKCWFFIHIYVYGLFACSWNVCFEYNGKSTLGLIINKIFANNALNLMLLHNLHVEPKKPLVYKQWNWKNNVQDLHKWANLFTIYNLQH
jgi:hypothetical protein